MHLRSAYLDAVASALAGVSDPGDGEIHRAARAAQQKILHGPRSNGGVVLDGTKSPREQFEAMAASNPKFKQASGEGVGVTIGGVRPAK
jgi:hypothetical protein